MKSVFILALSLFSIPALADGFRCETPNDSILVKIYNNVDPAIGTRVPAKVILSDSRRQYGNKTIAVFSDEQGLISADGASYELNVDSRFKGVDRGGEEIAGTKIAYLKTIAIDVDFSYARPVADGTRVKGTIRFVKENGERTWRALDCERYLKLK